MGLEPWMLWPYVNNQGKAVIQRKDKGHSAIAQRVLYSYIHGVEAQLHHCLLILGEKCFAFLFQRK